MEHNVTKKLYLSATDRKIAGVFGGLGAYFNIDSTILRLGFLLVLVCTAFFPMTIFYLLAWAVIPEEPIHK